MFSSRQKFYFQIYLKRGQAPITMKELNDVRIQLESDDTREKESAYEKVRVILERPKPGVDNEEVNRVFSMLFERIFFRVFIDWPIVSAGE